MIHLRSMTLKPARSKSEFPFNVPIIRTLETITFSTPVTFLVGENGSGKSTLLEAIAVAARSITVGSADAETDRTLAPVRALADQLKLVWSKRTHKGFFMRSEDFFGYARRMAETRADLEDDLRRVDEEYADRSAYAQGLARLAASGQLSALEHSYGDGLDAQSHGESYFKLFQARFKPGGLYLLDEPEAPLSPMRQLSFLAMLHQMVNQQAQFIIATHAPIILAYPGATILSFDGDHVRQVEYEELEHVTLTRDFLNNPDSYLRHLIET